MGKDRSINLRSYYDNRGALVVVEGLMDIPFEIKRIFYIYDVERNQIRGGHSHKRCLQLMIAVSGYFDLDIVCDNGEIETIHMAYPDQGVLIHPGEIATMRDYSPDAVCLVLASERYDEGDYVYERATQSTLFDLEAPIFSAS